MQNHTVIGERKIPKNLLRQKKAGQTVFVSASRICGQTDAVAPERNGELYQLDNNADFMEKIVELYKNSDLRTEMRKNNIEDSAKYSVDIAVKKMA